MNEIEQTIAIAGIESEVEAENITDPNKEHEFNKNAEV